jgi:hypothetical protein
VLPGGPVTAWPNADPARVCLGWQHAPARPDPGPPPPRPAGEQSLRLDPGWVAAQRLVEGRLARPARLGFAACAAVAGLLVAAWLAGLITAALAGSGALAALAGAATCARSAILGRRRLAALISAERDRIAAANVAEQRLLTVRQAEHASAYRAWRDRRTSFEQQQVWFAVAPSAGIDRVDVAGGTLAGWSALLTTIAVPRLSAGGQVTVLDLTEGAVAADLVNLAHRAGLRPLVWTLPRDLPRLDLGTGLGTAALADVLALAVSASPEAGQTVDTSADCALLERVLGVLGPDPAMAQVSAALRVLADIGDPRADLRSGLLTAGQLERIGTLFGRGAAERVVIERAWALESRLRWLNSLGSDPVSMQPSRLRVAALDRRYGVIGNRMLGTYLTAALTHMLRQVSPGSPWEHVLCLLGADRLRGEVIDLLTDACEVSRTGLVLGYRSAGEQVRERLGRGNAAIAFMRLGNGADARAASELIGTEHRFVVGQLTDTVGTSYSDTWGDSYTSTVGTSDSVADSTSVSESAGHSRGRGRSRQDRFAPFGDFTGSSSRDTSYSMSESGSVSLTEGISSGTSWGLSLSRALGENASLGRTTQRSREFLVEADELQRLPPSAVIVSYPGPSGRTVVLADANPAIGTLPGATLPGATLPGATLPGATLRGLDEERADPVVRRSGRFGPAAASAVAGDETGSGVGVGSGVRERSPNLGPPARRLDWRRPA